jgi:hypothetical protein
MADPPRLPPPPFWRTSYYATSVIGRPDRRDIDPADVRRAIATPYRRQRQPKRALATLDFCCRERPLGCELSLKRTATRWHNTFWDRGFKP